MKNIEIRNDCVYYYGNPAGYIDRDTAAVLDNMFRGSELEALIAKRGLMPEWTDGVYDRLANGGPVRAGETAAPLKSCRIWQLKPDVDVMMKFIGYSEMLEHFGEPKPENYSLVYDGRIETNEPEEIWTKFNVRHPAGFTGHSLSISDVIELYDHTGSEFHYVDRFGFERIPFDGREPEQGQGMNMSM
jgi:hypothetical protein